MKDLEGANAIVTGASRGLGVLIADALAREGVNLVLAARSADALEKVRGDVGAAGVKPSPYPPTSPRQISRTISSRRPSGSSARSTSS